MDKAQENHPNKEWSGYKKATFIISFLSVLVIAVQAIYTHYYNQSWKEIEYLSHQLEVKRAELKNRLAIPKIKLSINTLEKVGLSKQMLRSLTTIPSTISVQHASGATAKGLLLDIKFSEPIVQFQEWQSAEPFTIKEVYNENILRMEASSIRKGSVIGVTVLTNKIPKIETVLLLDSGELQEDKSEDRLYEKPYTIKIMERPWSKPIEIKRFLSGKDHDRGLETEISHIEDKINFLRDQSLFNWMFENLRMPVFIISPLVIIFTGAFIVYRNDIKKDIEKRELRAKTVNQFKYGVFKANSLCNVLAQLGPPDNVVVNEQVGEEISELVYFSKYEWFRKRKGIRFTFSGEILNDVFDVDDGISLYDAQQQV